MFLRNVGTTSRHIPEDTNLHTNAFLTPLNFATLVRFDVLPAVTMKRSVFQDMTLCSLYGVRS
jgi:hypothetical protein